MRWLWLVVTLQSLSTAYGFFALGQIWVGVAQLILAALCAMMAIAIRPRGVFYIDESGIAHAWSDALARAVEFCESDPGRVVYVATGEGIILIVNPRALKGRKHVGDLEVAGQNHKGGD